MESFVFHRNELVPKNIKTKKDLEKYDSESQEPIVLSAGDEVRNRNNLTHLMYVQKQVREGKKLLGFLCYWWE